MPVHKRKYISGKTVWFYQFDVPGSTRTTRRLVKGSGFATKGDAIDAEAAKRIEEQQKFDLAKRGGGAEPIPTTLKMLLDEFRCQHAQEELAPKTVERYREQAAYISLELSAKPLSEITPLHLTREWARLLKSGGHTRKTKSPRPLSAKTVRNIAGVVSSAFSRAIKWGLATTKSGHQQRAAQGEEAPRHCTDSGPAKNGH
jgi:hypothetical protein